MPVRLLLLFGNAFVVAYAADAGFSLVEEAFRALTGSFALLPLRNLLAGIVVLGSLPVMPALALTPRLAPSVLAPLALSALWLASGAAPLPLLLAPPLRVPAVLALQLALAALAFLRIRALSGGRSWILGHEWPRRPDVSLGHSLRVAAAVVVGGSVLVAAYLPLWVLTSVQVMTDGFVRFDLQGVSLADRRYERDGQEIRLVGMVHVGEEESYRALVESFSGRSTVVLAEGVTDREGLLRQPLSYEHVARALGLEAQDPMDVYLDEVETGDDRGRPDVRRADVDLSEFHPDTIAWLESAAEIWDGRDPLGAIAQLYRRYAEDPDRWTVLAEDVLTRRNRHLLEEIQGALGEYDHVIVPWGALHQPFVQHRILDLGFEPTTGTYHPLASWKTVIAALRTARAAEGGPPPPPADDETPGPA